MDRFYRSLLPAGAKCFDVGANAGNRVASFRRIGCKVIAAEPQSKCHAYLVSRFGHDPDTVLLKQALGAAPGRGRIMISDADVLSSMSEEFIAATKQSGRFADQNWSRFEEVEIVTLDQLIAAHGVPDFIKIDVEGFELEVVRGLSRPVPLVALEWAPEMTGNLRKCLDRLEQLGPVQFNLSWGESMRMSRVHWLDRGQLEAIFDVFREESFLFADIYIRATPGPQR